MLGHSSILIGGIFAKLVLMRMEAHTMKSMMIRPCFMVRTPLLEEQSYARLQVAMMRLKAQWLRE